MMNNIVLRMLAAGAFTVLTLPVIAQSQQPFEAYEIPVPSTSSISYRMIDARRVGDGQIEVITRTTGKISGDIYVRHLVDCTRPRYQNWGESETLKGLKKGLKTRTGYPKWFRVVPDSTDEALYKAACERLTLLKP